MRFDLLAEKQKIVKDIFEMYFGLNIIYMVCFDSHNLKNTKYKFIYSNKSNDEIIKINFIGYKFIGYSINYAYDLVINNNIDIIEMLNNKNIIYTDNIIKGRLFEIIESNNNIVSILDQYLNKLKPLYNSYINNIQNFKTLYKMLYYAVIINYITKISNSTVYEINMLTSLQKLKKNNNEYPYKDIITFINLFRKNELNNVNHYINFQKLKDWLQTVINTSTSNFKEVTNKIDDTHYLDSYKYIYEKYNQKN
jgi:hypothetical protein